MKFRSALICTAVVPLASLAAGCAQRTGVAYLQIENDQGGGGRAEPIYVDPRVEVVQNEYARSYLNDGSNIRQTTRIRGPIMIIPAPGPTTQPIAPR